MTTDESLFLGDLLQLLDIRSILKVAEGFSFNLLNIAALSFAYWTTICFCASVEEIVPRSKMCIVFVNVAPDLISNQGQVIDGICWPLFIPFGACLAVLPFTMHS